MSENHPAGGTSGSRTPGMPADRAVHGAQLARLRGREPSSAVDGFKGFAQGKDGNGSTRLPGTGLRA